MNDFPPKTISRLIREVTHRNRNATMKKPEPKISKGITDIYSRIYRKTKLTSSTKTNIVKPQNLITHSKVYVIIQKAKLMPWTSQILCTKYHVMETGLTYAGKYMLVR